MVFVVYFSILIINLFFYNLQGNKSKENRLILFFSLLFLGLIFVGGIENADMNFYSSYYYNLPNRTFKATEIGFYIIVYVCRTLNLGLVGLRAFVFIISIAFTNAALKKTCTNRHLYLVLSMVFIFFINDIQLRNFISMSILMYASTFLFTTDKHILKYCLLIGLATIFHTSSILYLSFLLFELRGRRSLLQMIVGCSFLLEIVIYFNGKRIPFINSIVAYVLDEGSDRLIQYFASNTNGSFNVVLLIMANILLSYYSYYIVQTGEDNSEIVEFSRTAYYCSLLQAILLPLLFLNVEFYRYPRNVLSLVYISICHAFACIGHRLTVKKLVLFLMFLVNSALWIYIAYYRISDWNYVFDPIFYKNFFFTS